MAATAQIAVLIVDADADHQAGLSLLLSAAGYRVSTARGVAAALERLREDTFHLVLCDLQLPGQSGLSLSGQLAESCPATRVVAMATHPSVRTAVTALKRGASEYLVRPIRPRRLLALCRALTADLPAWMPNRLLAAGRSETMEFDGMYARSRLSIELFERIERAARADTTVLIAGESGTGKELVARLIHRRSARAGGPFVAVHTGAIPRDLIATELFGHERGAFTGAVERSPGKFEQAEGGTLFLDEISTMDHRTQINLLRVLESFRYTRVGGRKEKAADVRVLAATNRSLEEMVARGEFRSDLYYRLNVVAVRLPPLRERPEDVMAIAGELVREMGARYGKPRIMIPAETERLLTTWSWPGNVRELRNVIEQAILLARKSTLDPSLLPPQIHRGPPGGGEIRIAVGTPMQEIERQVILRTLDAHDGNKTAAAEALGISRRSIYNKLAEYSDKRQASTSN